jgi:hypothetical protein
VELILGLDLIIEAERKGGRGSSACDTYWDLLYSIETWFKKSMQDRFGAEK